MQADLNWLADPTVFRVNRLDAHSDHMIFRLPVIQYSKGERLRQRIGKVEERQEEYQRNIWRICPKWLEDLQQIGKKSKFPEKDLPI